MSWLTDHFAEAERTGAEALATAEREAETSGKERFDLATLELHLNRGPQAAREADHRKRHYLMHPEVRTLSGYAALLLEHEPWEEAR